MVTKTVLVCCSRTGTDWWFHGICSGTHWKVITKIFCKSIKLFLHNLLSHCVVCSRVIPCQMIQSYISDREQNPWNFISREILFWFQNLLNFLNRISIRKAMAGWNLQRSHLIFAYVFCEVCTFHDGCKQGIDQQIFNRNSISCNITHPQSLFKHLFEHSISPVRTYFLVVPTSTHYQPKPIC